jgi:hypothetical protein
MFSVPRVNVVASDEGFSVEVLGRTGIEYREGGRSAFVDSEVLAVGHGIAVFKDSIRAWRPPHDHEEMTAGDKQRIIENVRRAIEFQQGPVEVL